MAYIFNQANSFLIQAAGRQGKSIMEGKRVLADKYT